MELAIGIGGLVVAFAGVAATVLTVYLTGRQREEERAAAERTEERRQAIAALAPVQALLLDMSPSNFPVMVSSEQAEEALARLHERRLIAREPLIAVRIAHRDERVRELAEELIKAVDTAMQSLRAMVRAAFSGWGVGDYDTAAEDHEAAAATAEGLREALSPSRVLRRPSSQQ